MNILITGAKGFVGKNLSEAILNIKNGKDKTHPELKIDEIFFFCPQINPDWLIFLKCFRSLISV